MPVEKGCPEYGAALYGPDKPVCLSKKKSQGFAVHLYYLNLIIQLLYIR